MNWNLTEYLPKVGKCQQYFDMTIATFIFHVNNHMQDIQMMGIQGPRKRRNSSLSQQQLTQNYGVGVSDDASEYAKKLLSGEISRKLFE